MKYYWISDTKYVASGVNCLYSIINHGFKNIGMRQKSHDQLFQNSGLEICCEKCRKSIKVKFHCNIVTNYVSHMVNCIYSIITHAFEDSGMIQKSHDHLHKKSGQWSIVKFLFICARL